MMVLFWEIIETFYFEGFWKTIHSNTEDQTPRDYDLEEVEKETKYIYITVI